MSRLGSMTVVGFYALMPLLVLGINWGADRNGTDVVRMPVFNIIHEKHRETGGVFPAGIPKLDLAAIESSMNRLPAVSLARQIGNSLRIAGGQRLNWVVWGGRQPLMLFPQSELWVSEGINSGGNRQLVDEAASAVRTYAALLKSEDWTLVVVPVPTKLSIHRDLGQWPILDKDLLSREPITEDRSDEIVDALFRHFDEDSVFHVDLRTVYRTYLAAHPGDLMYGPGESHWSGLGIKLASEATAEKVSQVANIPLKVRVPTYLDVDRVGDMAAAFDAHPKWLSGLRPAYSFHDRLVNGERGKGYVYAARPQSLLVVAGTSYTGQYTWLTGQPVGFTWAIGGLLEDCEIQNRPFAGQGSFYAFRRFLDERSAIARDFIQRRHLTTSPRVVVWEFPLRDLGAVIGQ